MKKPRPFQLTCRCSRYSFPHRLGGGRCDSADWAEAYFIYIRQACLGCNNHYRGFCDVASGAESIQYCEAYMEAMRVEFDPLPQVIRHDLENYNG